MESAGGGGQGDQEQVCAIKKGAVAPLSMYCYGSETFVKKVINLKLRV